jgi:nucleoside-diphosphate-sugar epimerase
MRNKIEGKRALVTGGAGFIGTKLVDRLKQVCGEVIVFDKVNGQDITRWSDLESLPNESFDLVFHLAGKLFIPESWKNPREYYEVNTLGTLNALEFCRKNNIPRIVFVSTYVYGQPRYLPIDEKHPLMPNNPYARSKMLAEELCRAYHENFNISCVILRPFNIYGRGQDENFLVPKIIKSALKNNEITLNDPRPKRDLLYLDDLIEVFIKAAEYTGSDFDIFNIGSGRSYEIGEIIETVADVLGKPIRAKYLNKVRKDEIPETVADITKANKMLGWAPRTDLETGMREMIG